MLVHICCSVDSHYFLKCLRQTLPNEPLKGFFYNPNIHPYEEYRLRLLDVKRSCDKYDIELLEGEYDYDGWIKSIDGLELERERGKRCEVCFEARLEITAGKAKEINEKSITTTLFMSPKKSFEQLEAASRKIGDRKNIEVLCFDFRKGGGTNKQFQLARDDKLYHQNYCGCFYALKQQREAKDRFAEELISPIGKDILPASVKDRTRLYEKICHCEKNGIAYDIKKERFQNYRLLFGRVIEDMKTLPSYFIGDLEFNGIMEVEITDVRDGFGFTKNDLVLFMDLAKFNEISDMNYKNVKELIFNPIKYDKRLEIECRFLDCNSIIVLDSVKQTVCKIEASSVSYSDVREVLAIL